MMEVGKIMSVLLLLLTLSGAAQVNFELLNENANHFEEFAVLGSFGSEDNYENREDTTLSPGECNVDADCDEDLPFCDEENTCIGCLIHYQCTEGFCNAGICEGCTSNDDCGKGENWTCNVAGICEGPPESPGGGSEDTPIESNPGEPDVPVVAGNPLILNIPFYSLTKPSDVVFRLKDLVDPLAIDETKGRYTNMGAIKQQFRLEAGATNDNAYVAQLSVSEARSGDEAMTHKVTVKNDKGETEIYFTSPAVGEAVTEGPDNSERNLIIVGSVLGGVLFISLVGVVILSVMYYRVKKSVKGKPARRTSYARDTLPRRNSYSSQSNVRRSSYVSQSNGRRNSYSAPAHPRRESFGYHNTRFDNKEDDYPDYRRSTSVEARRPQSTFDHQDFNQGSNVRAMPPKDSVRNDFYSNQSQPQRRDLRVGGGWQSLLRGEGGRSQNYIDRPQVHSPRSGGGWDSGGDRRRSDTRPYAMRSGAMDDNQRYY